MLRFNIIFTEYLNWLKNKPFSIKISCLFGMILLSLPLSSESPKYRFTLPGFNKETLIIDDTLQSVNMDEYLYFLSSEREFLTFEELLGSGEYKYDILPPGKSPNFGYSQDTYYSYFRIQDQRRVKDEIFLILDYPVIDSIELLCFDSDGNLSVNQKSGDHTPFDEWRVKYRKPGFFLDVDIRECVIKGKSGSSVQFPLTLYSMIEFYEVVKKDSIVQSLYFGALICMVLYNIFIGISIRSIIYFYYSGFLISFGLFQGSFLGINFILFTNRFSSFIIDNSLVMFIIINSACIILFFLNLLDIKNKLKSIGKIGNILLTLILILFFLSFFLSYSIIVRLSSSALFVSILYVFSSSLYLTIKKDKMATIYLSAWIIFLIGTISLYLLSLGILGRNVLTLYGSQIGSVIEFILLSIAMGYRLNLLQEKIALDLKEIVSKQDKLLREEKDRAEKQAELIRMVEREKENAKNAYFQLEASQRKLIQSDKMITLGTMVAGVAHEINTPLGAIKASSEIITEKLAELIKENSTMLELNRDDWTQILFLIRMTESVPKTLSTKESRVQAKKLKQFLEQKEIQNSELILDLILDLGLAQEPEKIETILGHQNCTNHLMIAGRIVSIKTKSNVIESSANRVSKIVNSLKSYMHFENKEEMVLADLSEGMETVLTILQSKMKNGIEVIKEYESIPEIFCFPDELNQVWTNLIHNSIQAMNGIGKITIKIFRSSDINNKQDIDNRDFEFQGAYIVVSIEDNGPGIPSDIRTKIFEAFFTTKPVGEGSGLGLHIIGKILEKHRGTLELESAPGRTLFTTRIPEKTS